MVNRTSHWIVCVLIVVLACRQGQALAPKAVVINEIMASNTRTLADPQGQFDDWIELTNTTNSPIDVGGMFLTDDLSDPARWQIPDGNPQLTMIGPHKFLLIWADGDTGDAGLHAGFGLSADGEELALVADDGTVIDQVVFGEQRADLSYGRWTDGKEVWQVMTSPTPGAANKVGVAGIVADVRVSPHRGFYDAPVDVTLTTTTPGAEIWYTLDAEAPHPEGLGWTAVHFASPIRISHTTCIRAMAVKSGWKDSEVTSHTLIFLNDVIRQPVAPAGFPSTWGPRRADYAMDQRVVDDPAYRGTLQAGLKAIPSVCIAIPNADFFGVNGLYTNGTQKGDSWERAAGIEWIDPCTGAHFGINAGLRSHGAVGRGDAKHALRAAFRSEYGAARLDFPLFPGSPIHTFDGLVFRSQWNYSWTGDSVACGGLGTRYAEYLREVFARDTCLDLGILTPHARHVHLYVNGLYWGLYLLSERPDEGFAVDHLGGDKEDYDVLKASNGGTMEVKSGDTKAWDTLFATAAAGAATAQAYQGLSKLVDVQSLIDYMLMIYYTGSRDAPVLLCNDQAPRNFYAIRRRVPAGPFVFLPWDVEWSLEKTDVNRVRVVGTSNPHYLMSKLATNAEFRMHLADRIQRHFFRGGALTADMATARYMGRADQIDGAIVAESARWGDDQRAQPYTRTDWLFARDYLLDDYFPVRTGIVLDQLKAQGWYPSVDAPVFRIDGKEQYGGQVRAGASLTLVNPKAAGVIYYTLNGSDPRVPGTGQQAASAVRYAAALTLRASTQVKARILNGSTWSSLAEATFAVGPVAEGLRITEVMYHPGSAGAGVVTDPNREFIELTNVGTQSLNLALVRFTHGIDFTFPSQDLGPSQIVVVVADQAAFQAAYGKTVTIAGVYAGSLSNDGERIEVQDPIGRRLADFRTCDDWFPQTDGGGYSLTVRDPKADPNGLSEASHWRASTASGGSPGKAEAAIAIPSPGPVVLGEIMYHPADYPDAEYVELVNISTKAVTLYDAATRKAWRFTDGGSGGVQYTFQGTSSVTLQAGQRCLLVKNLTAFKAAFSLPQGVSAFQWTTGALDNAGDDLQLYSPLTATTFSLVDEVRYSDGSHGEGLSQDLDPWPAAADGSGLALARIQETRPGNDASNWRAVEPSPGRP